MEPALGHVRHHSRCVLITVKSRFRRFSVRFANRIFHLMHRLPELIGYYDLPFHHIGHHDNLRLWLPFGRQLAQRGHDNHNANGDYASNHRDRRERETRLPFPRRRVGRAGRFLGQDKPPGGGLLQQLRRLERRGRTAFRLRRAHEREHVRDRRRHLRPHRPHVRQRLALDRLGQQLHRRAALVRTLPRQHLVEDDAERVDVRPRVDVVRVHHLLRRHVRGRTDDHARRRHRRLVLVVRELRHAKVRQLRRPVSVEHDVVGLDVPVDHAVPVRHLEGKGDLGGDRDCLGYWQRALRGKPILHAAARHVVHDDVAKARIRVFAHVVH